MIMKKQRTLLPELYQQPPLYDSGCKERMQASERDLKPDE